MLETIIIIGSILLDQISKILVKSGLEASGKIITIIPGVLQLEYSENTGMAFGMLSESTVLLSIASVAMTALLFYMIIRYRKTSGKLYAVSLAMIAGGAIGNAIDRIFRGYVVDFISPIFIDFAIFNIADSFICVGAGLLILYMLVVDHSRLNDDKKQEKNNADQSNS